MATLPRQSDSGSSDNFQVVPSFSDDEETAPFQQGGAIPDPQDNGQDHEDDKSERPPPPPLHPVVAAILHLTKRLLMPIVRIVFAPRAQRTLIQSTAIGVVLFSVLLTSFMAYLTFYRQYVPQLAHIEPVYFQYVNPEPAGHVDFIQGGLIPPLRHEQSYDVSLQLHVPTSDINFDLGNFMVSVWLQTSSKRNVAYASRPAILRYQSNTQRVLRVFAKALPLLVGLSEESQVITVPLIEGYVEKKSQPITQATVALSSAKLQVYDAKLRVLADFQGLRYYMYHHRIITAIGFISLFIVIELVCAAVAWKFFGQNLWHKLHAAYEHAAALEEEQTPRPEEEEDIAEEHRLMSERDEEDDDASSI